MVAQRLTQISPPAAPPDQLWQRVEAAWSAVPQEHIQSLFESMPRRLWLLKLDWDSPLPEALATKWKTFQKEFEEVCSIHISRWIHTASQKIILHGFCDASELAYASVIYAVKLQADGSPKVTLLVAKSRVAPLKPASIPKLELNGAVLFA
ncbi:uncharacterized protein TNCV_583791 [Trichonephila clavipes]|nr:uncharacterized protein TNCV_583791 [Trichonephila clavipes]